MKIVINAGGKGTRISTIEKDLPKPMIKLNGISVLERQITGLKEQGFTELIFIVGYLKERIQEYFGNGEKWNIHIEYIEEKETLGTAGALWYLKNIQDDILFINADLCFDVDIKAFYLFHKSKQSDITLITHPNNHPYDSVILVTDEEKRVINRIDKNKKNQDYKNQVNAGIHLIQSSIIKEYLNENQLKKKDLDDDIIKRAVLDGNKAVFAYDTTEYIKDMGTPERYQQVCEDLKSGLVKKRSCRYKKRAVFLDRDGTINKEKGFLTNKEEIELFDEAAQAIKILNERGFLVIIVTNQPIIARGESSVENLLEIHNRIERLLGEEGAFVDAIYYCPHHPDQGFKGEIKKLKMQCECRKPKPGMLLRAAQEYDIDLSESYMIGDNNSDVKAGESAGCKKSILIYEGLKMTDVERLI